LGRLVSGPGEGEDPPALMAGHLDRDVGRRAEAVEAQSFGVAGQDQRAVADEARAEEGSGGKVGIALGDGKAEALAGDRVLGEAAIAVVAGETSPITEVLAPGAAGAAVATCPAEPGHAHSAADGEARHAGTIRHHRSHDLVAEDEGQLGVGQLAVDDVKVRAAHAAGRDAQQDLARPGLGKGTLLQPQRAGRRLQDHGAHELILASPCRPRLPGHRCCWLTADLIADYCAILAFP
jgi:hypothetical protein